MDDAQELLEMSEDEGQQSHREMDDRVSERSHEEEELVDHQVDYVM